MTNRLAQSTSPYLQQHAANPGDWHEWGPEALRLARETGKPILLSVGYSACHWCHVMAHESFEDEGIAALMNELFVNIKVDREERPDLDQIYQSAHAMLTQRSGGWPLTMFLTPDTVPFFGGTYFPKSQRYGLPGFGDLLTRVAEYHGDHAIEIGEQNARLLAALGRTRGDVDEAAALDAKPIEEAALQMIESFDRARGGFGGAPKFPHPEMLEFCLRRFARTGHEDVHHAACFTLERMCLGGIYDQLGGGFARYSVDAEWAIPHFEKMLYDNGPLLGLLADARRVAENEAQGDLFSACMRQTVDWILREMQSPSGGYYSTLDADSEGHEGKFYVWTAEEIQALLPVEAWPVVRLHYGLDRRPNFEERYWNPLVARSLAEVDQTIGAPGGRSAGLLAEAKRLLFAAREKRIHPGRDEKILTSWNALMIEGMARAARAEDRADWLDSARRGLAFVLSTSWDTGAPRLCATHKDGKTRLNAYLDDYAFLLKALLEMMQADFRTDDLEFARALADVLLEQFEDRDAGGFYFTAHDHEPLIQRPKPAFDNATPSGNGVAAYALQRLGHLTGETRYLDAAERTLTYFTRAIDEHPAGHGSLLMALAELLEPPTLVVVNGPAADFGPWRETVRHAYHPEAMTLFIANGTAGLPDALKKPESAGVNAWVCRGVACLPPADDPARLPALMKTPIVSPG